MLGVGYPAYRGVKIIENEANDFASELLLPEADIQSIVRKRRLSMDLVKDISEDYGISLTATALKIIKVCPDQESISLEYVGKMDANFRLSGTREKFHLVFFLFKTYNLVKKSERRYFRMPEIIYKKPLKFSGVKKVRVWGKGQFTIPVEMRQKLGIEEDTILEVFQVGKALIATPEKLVIRELVNSVQKEMAKNKIGLVELLADLREGNHEYETK